MGVDVDEAGGDDEVGGVDDLTGRGMAMVAAYASAWGVERVAGGKRVWFEVDG